MADATPLGGADAEAFCRALPARCVTNAELAEKVAAADLQSPALIVIGAVAGNYSAKREAGLLAARYGASAGVPAADSAHSLGRLSVAKPVPES